MIDRHVPRVAFFWSWFMQLDISGCFFLLTVTKTVETETDKMSTVPNGIGYGTGLYLCGVWPPPHKLISNLSVWVSVSISVCVSTSQCAYCQCCCYFRVSQKNLNECNTNLKPMVKIRKLIIWLSVLHMVCPCHALSHTWDTSCNRSFDLFSHQGLASCSDVTFLFWKLPNTDCVTHTRRVTPINASPDSGSCSYTCCCTGDCHLWCLCVRCSGFINCITTATV